MPASNESLRSWPSHAAGVSGPSNGSVGAMFPQPLLDVLASHPDHPAFEHGRRIVTCGEVLDTVRRLVAGFDRADVGPGDGVAMITSSTPEAFSAYVAAFTVGCRVVGLPPGFSAAQCARLLGADVDAVVVDSVTDLPGTVLSLGPVAGATDLLASGEGAALTVRAMRDDVARLVHTSDGKGCVQTYQAMSTLWAWQPKLWSPEIAALAAGYDRYLLTGTMASPMILDHVALCLFAGGTAVIPTDDEPAVVRRYRISAVTIPAPELSGLLDEHADTSSLKALTVFGSPVGVARFAEAVDVLGPVVHHAYGQLEAGPIAMLTPADVERFGAAALPTVGRPHPGVDVEIRAAGGPVEPGGTGDIVVRTPWMMTGYWRDPEHTVEVLVDGWLHTGDVGRVDDNGLLIVIGRGRDTGHALLGGQRSRDV